MVHALALVPDLHVAEAEPQADADALRRLALWCHRYTPLVAVDGTAGLWLDVAGCAGPFGTEEALLRHMLVRFEANGCHARAALADTPGAAHALARFGPSTLAVVPPGAQWPAVTPLPVASLRLAPGIDTVLRRLGFARVGDLSRISRAMLAQRFGSSLLLRLNQVRGDTREPLAPLLPELALQCRIDFPEPVLAIEALHATAHDLVGSLCQAMERDGVGARRLDLMFEHVDRGVTAIRIGTVRASRDARHLARLLLERFEVLDPGEGIEAMHLFAPLTSPLRWTQHDGTGPDVAPLVDRLVNRLGQGGVYCTAPVHTAIPERTTRKGAAMAVVGWVVNKRQPAAPRPALPGSAKASTKLVVVHDDPGQEMPLHDAAAPAPARFPLCIVPSDHPVPGRQASQTDDASDPSVPLPLDGSAEEPLPWKPRPPRSRRTAPNLVPWPGHQPAPLRLLAPPRPVQVLAELPDQPPRAFTWRRHRHVVRRADGPRRIGGEWWRTDGEAGTVRDYFLVEDDGGQRFWLFRQGDGLHFCTGSLDWFLHGLF